MDLELKPAQTKKLVMAAFLAASLVSANNCGGQSAAEKAKGEAGDKKIEALLPNLKRGMSVKEADALGLGTFCTQVSGSCQDAFPAGSAHYTLVVVNGHLESLSYGRSNVNLLK